MKTKTSWCLNLSKHRCLNFSERYRRKGARTRELLTFSFKDVDQTQPLNAPQSIQSWSDEGLLKPLLVRIKDLSKLTRDDAVKQGQIKIYGDFPPKAKTDFTHPKHVKDNVAWAVIKKIGGQLTTVVGYVIENTFYVVFFDKKHRFWISSKKNT